MPLPQEVIDHINANNEIKEEIYFDRDDELTEEQVQKIFNAGSKDEILEVLNDIENEIIENNYELADEKKDSFRSEVR